MDFLNTEVIPDVAPLELEGGWGRMASDVVETVLMAVVLFLFINALTARIRVESISMQPNLIENDFVLVYRLAYRLGEPQRGDVVVFQYPPETTQVPYIKRVIGLPGDQIKVEGGQVYINGKLLVEPYLTDNTNRGGEWTVPPEQIFVMGDNRNNSSDSRAFGTVPLEDVIGKALVVYFPPEHWQMMTHAYDSVSTGQNAAGTAAVP